MQDSANQCTGANKVVPLPGVLNHREFTRTKTDLGRCSVCGEGRACTAGRRGARLYEACYACLVQAWNGKRGIV